MTPAQPSVILIEFNELTPDLMHRFMSAGQLPNFKRLYDQAQVYVTDAEEEGERLNPWVQWVSVHNGLSASEHGIMRLSDGHKLTAKAVWDVLSEAGLRVWVCGSMNARYDKPLNGCLMPDPWSTGLTPYPAAEFEPYYKFVRFAVQEHSDKAARPSKWDALKFVRYMATHGLSPHTVRSIVRQLWSERVRKKDHWKRAALLDRLQWDVFRSYYRRLRPHFSSFFLNSTAHFQHAYWRDMEPELFTTKPTEAHRQEHKDAILYGYQNMDDLVGRFLRLAGDEATLIFCTGLSQQPFLQYEAAGGRHYYRIKTPQLLTERLGIEEKFTYNPVMAEQFCLRFESAEEAQKAQATLERYRVGARCAFHCAPRDQDLMVQCSQTTALPQDTTIAIRNTDQTIPFFEIFYQVEDVKSAFHHPDGMLWVRGADHEHRVHDEKVSLRSIAPFILDLLNVPCPDTMSAEPFTHGAVATR